MSHEVAIHFTPMNRTCLPRICLPRPSCKPRCQLRSLGDLCLVDCILHNFGKSMELHPFRFFSTVAERYRGYKAR